MAETYVPVADLDELNELEMKVVNVAGRNIVITLMDGRPYAFDRTCPHEGWPLEKGSIHRGSIYCEDHSWAFSLETGKCVQPANGPELALFPIEEHDGKWCVRVDD
jgi:nitrite reductase/ring-hydroxylating ferredoxin subunit